MEQKPEITIYNHKYPSIGEHLKRVVLIRADTLSFSLSPSRASSTGRADWDSRLNASFFLFSYCLKQATACLEEFYTQITREHPEQKTEKINNKRN